MLHMDNYKIRYGGMLLGPEERQAFMDAFDRNYWPLGEEGKLMEEEAAAQLGLKYGLLANSGSSACLLALAALELPKGSEVLIPAVTFPTVFNCILQVGLVPVVLDAKLGTYNLSPDDIEAALSPKTKAIICVHAVGNPCDMSRIMDIAKKHDLYVLEDNCDGWGSSINGRPVGSFGHISFTSFHAAHIVSMGQGGGVFTDDPELARRARMYRDWGRQSHITRRTNGDKWPELPADQDARFIYEKVGWNLSPIEPQAAMGRVQLRKADKIKELRQRNFNYLVEKLSKYKDLTMPIWDKNADICWFSLPLAYKNRASLIEHLESNGIETRSMFAGQILKHPAYEGMVERYEARIGGDLSQSEQILKTGFWVSVHPRYSTDELDYMVQVFDNYFKNAATS